MIDVAVRRLAVAVDLDLERLELELARRVGERRAAQPLVLDLLLHVDEFVLGALDRDLALELLGNLLVGLGRGGLDAQHLGDGDAEASLDRGGDLAGLQGEGGVGHRAIDDRGFRDGAEIDVGFLESALGGERLECRALGELVGGGRAPRPCSGTRSA